MLWELGGLVSWCAGLAAARDVPHAVPAAVLQRVYCMCTAPAAPQVVSNCKPSQFAYAPPVKVDDKKDKAKVGGKQLSLS